MLQYMIQHYKQQMQESYKANVDWLEWQLNHISSDEKNSLVKHKHGKKVIAQWKSDVSQ